MRSPELQSTHSELDVVRHHLEGVNAVVYEQQKAIKEQEDTIAELERTAAHGSKTAGNALVKARQVLEDLTNALAKE